MSKSDNAIPELVDHIHYDTNKPENNNVYISNIKSNYVKTFNGKEWILQERDKILSDIYLSKVNILEEKLIELQSIITEFSKERVNYFLHRFYETELENNVKDKIKLRLYNSKLKRLQ
jgi:hypothetical protein